MEIRRFTALQKLAKDILDADTGTQVYIDETLFQDIETNKISLTLKNYRRPQGVAT